VDAFLVSRGYAPDASAAGVMQGLQAFLAASEARMTLVSLDDLWLEEEPQNVPGTSFELPNWRRRMKRELDDELGEPLARRVLDAVIEARRQPYP
jgi:4-alpha-glucanotransferase